MSNSRLISATLIATSLLSVSCSRPGIAQLSPRPATDSVSSRIDSVVQAYMAKNGPASISIAIHRGGEVIVNRAWGVAEVETKKLASAETRYRIGSVSKQFTAALLLKLVDKGQLTLNDSIGRHLPGLRLEWRALTIDKLLNHTAGLQNDFRPANRRTENLSRDTLIAMAARDSMVSVPGTKWAYSNVGYLLLGTLVERLYAAPYGDVLRDQIARPLGLKTLAWCTTDVVPARGDATGYGRSSNGEVASTTYLHPSQSLGSGGICSTAADLAAWNHALHGGRVLSATSYTAMTSPRGASANYGFGIQFARSPWGSRIFGHTGGNPGYAAENAWFPAESLSVSVLFNTTPPGETLFPKLAAIALGHAANGSVASGVAVPTAPAGRPMPSADASERLVGVYEKTPMTITVSLEAGVLYGQPAGERKMALIPQSGTAFAVGGNATGLTVTFATGPDGRVVSMNLSQRGTTTTLAKIR